MYPGTTMLCFLPEQTHVFYKKKLDLVVKSAVQIAIRQHIENVNGMLIIRENRLSQSNNNEKVNNSSAMCCADNCILQI